MTKEKQAFLKAIDRLKRLKGKELGFFVAGFVDGEGSFNISFAYHPNYRSNFIVNPKFQVYQHKDYEEVLWMIKDIFGTGKIDQKWGTDVKTLTISGRQNLLEKVIPYFKRYPLATKQPVLEKFEKIMKMLINKDHLGETGYREIVEIAYDMNQHGKARKLTKEELLRRISESFRLQNPQRPNVEHRASDEDRVHNRK